MRRPAALLIALLPLAACDAGSPGADGPLALGIVAGNNQIAPAGAERLEEPVVGKLVRQPGQAAITFQLVTPAYAQGTVVQGSPVAGAVVCAVNVAGEMEAFTPCTNTGSDGTARFFFAPGTKAGEARAEIRGTVEGEPAVFDTVTAQVQAGPVSDQSSLLKVGSVAIDGVIGLGMCRGFDFVDDYGNAITCDATATGSAAYIRDGDHQGGSKGQPYLVLAAGAKIGDTATVEFTRADDGSVLHTWVLTLTEQSGDGMRASVEHQ